MRFRSANAAAANEVCACAPLTQRTSLPPHHPWCFSCPHPPTRAQIKKVDDCIGPVVEDAVKAMKNGDVSCGTCVWVERGAGAGQARPAASCFGAVLGREQGALA